MVVKERSAEKVKSQQTREAASREVAAGWAEKKWLNL